MKTKFHSILIMEVSYFLILLFVYTASAKLIDIGIFRSQMAQSEMLRPHIVFLSWSIPLAELALAGLLLAETTRAWGLLGSFAMMLGFSLYVYLIMTYSPSLPCSCGGVLEAMDWETHLYFNLGLSLFSGLAWLLERGATSWIWAAGAGLGMGALVFILFVARPQEKVLRDESFTRNYIDIRLKEIADYNLPYNSYYISGVNDSLVYFGNTTGFTHGLQWNYRTGDTLSLKIQIPDAPPQFESLPKWQVVDGQFYIGEGVGPSLYKGRVGSWTAYEFMPFIPYYSDWVIVDSTRFIVKALQASTQKHVLAHLTDEEPYVQIWDVLEQEPGNLFQADGKLIWDTEKQQAVHLYFYRNYVDYVDNSLSSIHRLSLLYNLDHSNFKTNKGKGGLYLRENPIVPLHTHIRLFKENYLIRSNVMGDGEEPKDFLSGHTIDVYREEGYRFSFRIPSKERERMRDFYVTAQHIIVLYATWAVVYEYDDFIMAIDKQEKPNT